MDGRMQGGIKLALALAANRPWPCMASRYHDGHTVPRAWAVLDRSILNSLIMNRPCR